MSDWQARVLAAHKAKEDAQRLEWEMLRRRRGVLMAPLLRSIVCLPALAVESDSVELDGWTFSWPFSVYTLVGNDKPPSYLEMRRKIPGCGHVFVQEFVRDAAGAGQAIERFERGFCRVCLHERLAKEVKEKSAA